jgi:hypothetical protein
MAKLRIAEVRHFVEDEAELAPGDELTVAFHPSPGEGVVSLRVEPRPAFGPGALFTPGGLPMEGGISRSRAMAASRGVAARGGALRRNRLDGSSVPAGEA